MLAQRRWTERERRIVWRGLTGRFALAIEPLLGIAFMVFITLGIVWRAHHVPADATLIKIAPIFGVGAIAFLGYFIALLAAPMTAYAQTFKPIYIVDGYLRYRKPDQASEIDSAGYVATLFEDKSVACEWAYLGSKPLPDAILPAVIEFSVYAGIHSVDGKPTGLVPDEELPALAIGIAARSGPAGFARPRPPGNGEDGA